MQNLTAEERKARPMATGVLDYFPNALMYVAYVSKVGNDQHNPGEPLHWAMHKSTDEADALMRHLKDRGTIDSDNVRHSGKVAWRALAMLERELLAAMEAEKAVPKVGTTPQMLPDNFVLAQSQRNDDHHHYDTGELPAPFGSRPSHYEGDFGKMKVDEPTANYLGYPELYK